MDGVILIQIRITRRTLACGLAGLLLCAAGYEAISESLTMTTYYPSPSGVYRKLVSTGQAILARDGGNLASGAGNRFAVMDLHRDDTYTDFGLRLARWNTGANADSYIRHRGTGVLSLEAMDAGSVQLKAGGRVGLLVNSSGKVRIPDGTQGDKKVLTSDANGTASWKTPAPPLGTKCSWRQVSPFECNTKWRGTASVSCNAGEYAAGMEFWTDSRGDNEGYCFRIRCCGP
jgi:hypothetical protein